MSASTRRLPMLLSVLGLFATELTAAAPPPVEKLSEHLEVVRGPVNGAIVRQGSKALAVYGDPGPEPVSAELVLFTHHRRDVVWAGRPLVERGATPVVPQEELALFSDVERFWSEFEAKRFQDSAQQTTKILTRSLPGPKAVRGGEVLKWEGLEIRVLDTPGYTRGAVSYLVELDGRRVAFTGDCILAGGKVPDLYSMQDAIREAGIGSRSTFLQFFTRATPTISPSSGRTFSSASNRDTARRATSKSATGRPT